MEQKISETLLLTAPLLTYYKYPSTHCATRPKRATGLGSTTILPLFLGRGFTVTNLSSSTGKHLTHPFPMRKEALKYELTSSSNSEPLAARPLSKHGNAEQTYLFKHTA